MRNLLLFISKYHVFFIFLLLEAVSFSLYIRFNYYQRASFINTANEVTGNFYSGVSSVEEYFALRSINDDLQRENAELRARLNESMRLDTARFQLKLDTQLRQKYTYMPADVVKNSVNRANNFITLNKGSAQGVEQGMGVITDQGVAGVIFKVSENFSVAMSLLNKNFKIPPKIEENNYFGSITWNGDDPRYASFEDLNMYVPVKEGQKVVTSNNSNIFPENIPIGVIEEKYVPPGSNFYKIKVRLFTNFETLRKVYVVKNLLKTEQDLLEKQSNID